MQGTYLGKGVSVVTDICSDVPAVGRLRGTWPLVGNSFQE